MGLYSGGLINGRIFVSKIWEAYFREGLFLEGLVIGILRYTMFSISRSFFGHFPTIPDYFKISEDYRRLTEIFGRPPKTDEDVRRLPKLSIDYRRCQKTTGDFQEEIRKFSTSFLSLSYSHGKEIFFCRLQIRFFFRERNPCNSP